MELCLHLAHSHGAEVFHIITITITSQKIMENTLKGFFKRWDRYRKVKKENMQEIPWGKETLGALDTPLKRIRKESTSKFRCRQTKRHGRVFVCS